MRLDKLLSHAGHGSRRDVAQMIRAGRVQVFGEVARDPAMQVPADADICVDGANAGYQPSYYLMMNKPAGVLTATCDPNASTVLDLLTEAHRKSGVFSVGRLDKDVTGLLLLTNDGALAHKLTSPSRGVPKVYEALCETLPSPDAAHRFSVGLPLSDFTARPARLEILSQSPPLLRVTLTEGRFHQVKRMLAAVGSPVLRLARISFAGVPIDPALSPGSFRPLTDDELALLSESV